MVSYALRSKDGTLRSPDENRPSNKVNEQGGQNSIFVKGRPQIVQAIQDLGALPFFACLPARLVQRLFLFPELSRFFKLLREVIQLLTKIL